MEKQNPLLELESYGQSVWLDFLSRGLLGSGQLQRLIEADGLSGVTDNPSIIEKAVTSGHDYDDDIRRLRREGKQATAIYEQLAVRDVQQAADLLRAVYDRLDGEDGFVSLEVSPALAYDTAGTIAEARRLWSALDRPNTFIKVPATREGLPAIEQLISEGINVNVTLLFGLPRYRAVANAYIAGLERFARSGGRLDRVASVASFFLSRIDVLLDPRLESLIQANGVHPGAASEIHGQTAIASAKIAYQIYKDIFASERFRALAAHGARRQRLLWASTSTKNPAYSDVKYVDALIGPQTINTLPIETIDAYRDHGKPAPRLEENVDASYRVLAHLPDAGVDIDAVTQQLEDEGVRKFSSSFDQLIKVIERAQTA